VKKGNPQPKNISFTPFVKIFQYQYINFSSFRKLSKTQNKEPVFVTGSFSSNLNAFYCSLIKVAQSVCSELEALRGFISILSAVQWSPSM